MLHHLMYTQCTCRLLLDEAKIVCFFFFHFESTICTGHKLVVHVHFIIVTTEVAMEAAEEHHVQGEEVHYGSDG